MVKKIGGPLALAFAMAALLLIINGVVSYQSISTLIADRDRVFKTQSVLEGLQELKTGLLQTETDARGYLLTGAQEYYDVYRQHLEEIPSKIEDIRTKISDNPSQLEKLATLETSMRSRLELLDEYVVRKQVLPATVITQSQGSEGKRRMDAVKAAISDIAQDERELLEIRVNQSKLSGQRTLLTFLIANAVLFVLLVMVFYLTMRDIRERKRNEHRL